MVWKGVKSVLYYWNSIHFRVEIRMKVMETFSDHPFVFLGHLVWSLKNGWSLYSDLSNISYTYKQYRNYKTSQWGSRHQNSRGIPLISMWKISSSYTAYLFINIIVLKKYVHPTAWCWKCQNVNGSLVWENLVKWCLLLIQQVVGQSNLFFIGRNVSIHVIVQVTVCKG